jgi:uncharacterized protein YprB with RNaseH-like and TPR domain
MAKVNEPRVLLLDIEATNLNANFGFMLCIGYKFMHEKKVHVLDIAEYAVKGDPTNDRELARAFAKVYATADMSVGWYSSKFDVPYINSRLLHHRLPKLAPIRHKDGWRIARQHLKLNSNRLASVCAFLGIGEKTPLSGPIWIKAQAGDRKALRYIIKHCRVDVLVLEEAYKRLRELDTTHPNLALSLRDGVRRCPTCAGTRLKSKGYTASATQIYQRFLCRDCGAYSRRTKTSGGVEVR